jgi:phage baseplate assembly protein W
MAIGISPALPLVYDPLDGPYRLTKTIREAILQNFKNLLLTNPGERIMDPDFGVGIRSYLFELDNGQLKGEMINNIRSQTNKYLNAVSIVDIKFSEGSTSQVDQVSIAESNALYVSILFNILPLDETNVLTLPLFTT